MSDPLGWRLKLGVVTPSTNTIVQPEYDAMRPPGVTNHVSRMHIPDDPVASDADFSQLVRNIDEALEGAVERVMTMRPDAVALGVSIEAIWNGGTAAASSIEERLAGYLGSVPLFHAADALPAALRAVDVPDGDIAVLTPYMPVSNSHISGFLAEMGFNLVDAVHLGRSGPVEIAHTPEQLLIRSLRQLADKRPRAIIQFGANLCMARLAGEAERWLGLPVIAVNTATYWWALRQMGIADKVYGFGSLLEVA